MSDALIYTPAALKDRIILAYWKGAATPQDVALLLSLPTTQVRDLSDELVREGRLLEYGELATPRYDVTPSSKNGQVIDLSRAYDLVNQHRRNTL